MFIFFLPFMLICSIFIYKKNTSSYPHYGPKQSFTQGEVVKDIDLDPANKPFLGFKNQDMKMADLNDKTEKLSEKYSESAMRKVIDQIDEEIEEENFIKGANANHLSPNERKRFYFLMKKRGEYYREIMKRTLSKMSLGK
jgi:hypothetical protein